MQALTFTQLLYRYWFYGWLFRDVNRGSIYERTAALQHNRSRSRWLPTYLRRWAMLGLVCFAIGWALEPHAPPSIASPFFLASVLTVPISAVTLAAWIGLRVPPVR